MKTGKWMAAAALAAMVMAVMDADAHLYPRVGRSKPEGPVAAERCNQKTCKVAVTVGAGCAITVKPEVLLIGAGNQDAAIVWEITKESQATFPSDGVAFKPVSRDDANGQFKKKDAPNDRTFIFLDANTAAGIFYYAVKVIDARRQTCTLDPPIINEF